MSTVTQTNNRRVVLTLGRYAYLSVVAPVVLFFAVPVPNAFLRLTLQEVFSRWHFPTTTFLLWLALAAVFGAASYGVVAVVEAGRESNASQTHALTAAAVGLGVGILLGWLAWWLFVEVKALLPEVAVLWAIAITVYAIAIVRTVVRRRQH